MVPRKKCTRTVTVRGSSFRSRPGPPGDCPTRWSAVLATLVYIIGNKTWMEWICDNPQLTGFQSMLEQAPAFDWTIQFNDLVTLYELIHPLGGITTSAQSASLPTTGEAWTKLVYQFLSWGRL